ncbi:MAG: hypothetical protein QHH15_00220 [Candidatus Thermoplasmatota archaeon]|nr:hypothetical protein [Candidatus Thermoplasmatota archaeon]
MVIDPSMFYVLMDEFGVEIEVITRTPSTIAGIIQTDEKGRTIYNEESSMVTARILENTGGEVMWNNAIEQSANATGLFFLDDIDKLNENSRLIYNGDIFYMKKPTKRITHYEVPLEKKEV